MKNYIIVILTLFLLNPILGDIKKLNKTSNISPTKNELNIKISFDILANLTIDEEYIVKYLPEQENYSNVHKEVDLLRNEASIELNYMIYTQHLLFGPYVNISFNKQRISEPKHKYSFINLGLKTKKYYNNFYITTSLGVNKVHYNYPYNYSGFTIVEQKNKLGIGYEFGAGYQLNKDLNIGVSIQNYHSQRKTKLEYYEYSRTETTNYHISFLKLFFEYKLL